MGIQIVYSQNKIKMLNSSVHPLLPVRLVCPVCQSKLVRLDGWQLSWALPIPHHRITTQIISNYASDAIYFL